MRRIVTSLIAVHALAGTSAASPFSQIIAIGGGSTIATFGSVTETASLWFEFEITSVSFTTEFFGQVSSVDIVSEIFPGPIAATGDGEWGPMELIFAADYDFLGLGGDPTGALSFTVTFTVEPSGTLAFNIINVESDGFQAGGDDPLGLPTSVFPSEITFSGSAKLIPTPGITALAGACGLATVRRRRR